MGQAAIFDGIVRNEDAYNAIRRLTNLSPVTWTDGWPYFGRPGKLGLRVTVRFTTSAMRR